MTPAEHEALREIGAYLGALAEDLARQTESMYEMAGFAEGLAKENRVLQDALATLTSRFVEMHDEQREMNSRLTRYLDDAARAETGVKQLQSEVRKVSERLKAVGG